jgi:MFS family permease
MSQAIYSCVNQAAFVLATLVVFTLTQSPALAGLATGVIWGGRVLIVYQTGKLMDRMGRKRVLLLGFLTGCIALAFMGWAVVLTRLDVFWFGLLTFGFGSGIIQQSRIAVMDMYPVERRGEGMGYLMTANIIGSFLSPVFTEAMNPVASLFSTDVYAVVLLVGIVVLAFASIFTLRIEPDPKDIAADLSKYYPDVVQSDSLGDTRANKTPLLTSIMFFPVLAAFIASAFAWGDMGMMMSLVSVILHEHHMELTLINFAVTLHVFGMYGLSFPLGWLSDKVGRRFVIMLGGLILGVGALLTPLTSAYWIIVGAIFLVGLGWSAVNVATTALITDTTSADRRGRILGANDMIIGLSSISLPAFGGLVISGLGFVALGVSGLIVALPPLLVMLPLRELRPGKYAAR